jgi:hypothetical protein
MPASRTLLLLGATVVLAFASSRAQAAEPPERAEALLSGDAADRLLAKLLPVAVDVPADKAAPGAPTAVRLVEARFCGAAGPSRGRLIGVVRPDGAAAAAPPLLTGPHDCQDKLADVLRRGGGAAPDAEPVAIVEVLAAWTPWQLKLSLGDSAVGGGKDGGAALGAALARAKAAGPIQSIDTAALPLATPDGGSQPFDLGLTFLKGGEGVLLALAPAGRPGAREGHAPPPDKTEGAVAPDATIAATYALVNRLVALYTDRGPMVLEVGGQTVEVRELAVAGSDGALTVRGRATPRSIPESVRISIESSGADLRISQVRAAPELEDCAAMSTFAALGCRARNAARGSAASALAGEMTSRYRGQTLRNLTPLPASTLQLGQRRLNVRLTPTRLRATTDGVVLYGKADIDPE